MPQHPIRLFIANYVSIADSDWQEIEVAFERFETDKGAIILQEGKICRYLYFLESGLLRFYLTKDGKDVTKFFTDAPYMFTSQVSFSSQTPAKETIQAIEKSVVWQISLTQANQLLRFPVWSEFIRKLIQEVQYYTEEILSEMQTETAETRYEIMLKNKPDWLQRIPLKYLASYLGIAMPSLSRIRKKFQSQSGS
ncbi:MAG: Crp/Fnr family transcriptional regulator [Chitinophagales bacterium]|nr:Crp/Fnr family transcriptional regulator [Chitinophagales bacterium]